MKSKLLKFSLSLLLAQPVLAELTVPGSLEPFFEKFCYDCHDTDTEKGDLDLEGLNRKITNATDAAHWQDILDQMNSGEMPPKKKKQPSKEELSAAIGDLTEVLFQAQEKLQDSGGEKVVRYLTRREYEVTIKELMGISLNAEKLPDDAGDRFDTIGKDQSFTSRRFEKYFSFAQDVSRTALHWALQPRAKSKVERKEFANTEGRSKKVYEIYQKNPKAFPFSGVKKGQREYYERNMAIHSKGRMLSHDLLVSSVGVTINPDPRAHYKIRFCGGVVDGVQTRRFVRVMRKGKFSGKHGIAFASLHIDGSIDHPSVHEVDYKPSYKPEKIKNDFVHILEDKRGGPGFEQFYHHYKPIEAGVPKDTIFAKWMELEGPFYDEKSIFEELVERYKVKTARDGELDIIAAEFLSEFSKEVFRQKTVPAKFISGLHAYYQSKRKAGLSFREAVIDPLAMILSSSHFLYLLEPDEKPKSLDTVSLANRLSYFLWSSPPDEELLALATTGNLLQTNVLEQQIDRLLDHPNAESFFKGFMSQWMHLKRFDALNLDSKLLLHRTDGMIEASSREPSEFFKVLVRENLSASNLIDSDFVTVNALLAKKYGLNHKELGNDFEKVKLPATSPRGGLLTQAAFLSMGTMGNRTSPVIRGALVKEILLNDPPPPPPPNVPELIHEGVDPLASVRTLVELHQEKAQCASCHARFDFIGLGLENFDAIGMWRDRELVSLAEEAQQLDKKPKKVYEIDASGSLPNGDTFNDIFGLKKALMAQKRQVAASLLEGLFCYAIGRDFSFTDRPFIQQTLNALELDGANEYQVRDMIKKIISSKAFLGK
ncbi:MAG: DUF1592 domain-containing protein [Lentisphaerales bacterium]|nr:DUF1592 domain-containing protein [Lentisphaerales bacterium]